MKKYVISGILTAFTMAAFALPPSLNGNGARTPPPANPAPTIPSLNPATNGVATSINSSKTGFIIVPTGNGGGGSGGGAGRGATAPGANPGARGGGRR
jgi:hypothetical protein